MVNDAELEKWKELGGKVMETPRSGTKRVDRHYVAPSGKDHTRCARAIVKSCARGPLTPPFVPPPAQAKSSGAGRMP